MKKLILFLAIFLVGEVFAQVTAPSGYTPNYRFRKYTQGANPSADSLNANWTLADTKIKLAYDSAQVKVNTYATQTITGAKTFSNDLTTSDEFIHTRENVQVTTTSFSVSGVTFVYLQPDAPYTVVTINGYTNGKIVYLINSGTDAVTLDDAAGNLQIGGDFIMGRYDAICLIYDSNSTYWIEIGRSNN